MSAERRETEITQSSSPPSADTEAPEATMVRRFVEASRRAEIIALVNEAGQNDLGERLSAELCEAFEAESAFVIAARAGGAPAELVGATGLTPEQRERLLHEPDCMGALGTGEPVMKRGTDLLGIHAQAIALAPADAGGERVLVGVARRYDLEFDHPELGLLEAVTGAAAHALQRTWLAADQEDNATRQTALARAAKALAQSLDPVRVLNTLCGEVARATGGDVVVVYFGDAANGLEAVAGYGVPDTFIGMRRGPGEGLGGRVVTTGAAQISNDYQQERLAPENTTALSDLHSAMSAPLRRRGRVDGAVSVGFIAPRWLTESDLELLSAFADLAGIACRNADDHAAAQRAASRDSLTGCLNHASFQERLREENARSERGADAFTLAMLDLENFKDVNDRFGHLSGDTVLRTVGETLRGAMREQDTVARFGGDEFAMLLPDTGEGEAGPMLDRVLGLLAGAPTPGGVPLRAHVGTAEWRPGEPPTSLIERADSQLRKSKTGRAGGRGTGDGGGDPDPAAEMSHERRAASRRKRLAVAARVGSKLSRILDTKAIAATAAQELTGTLEYDFAALARLSPDGEISVIGAVGEGTPAASGFKAALAAEGGPVRRCLRERRAVLSNAGGRSELAVPVHLGRELWGAINLRSAVPDAFDADDARLVELVADHTGAALRTAELYRKLEQTHIGVAEALAAALEAKDGYTAGHARWIAELGVEVGRELDLQEDELNDLRYGAIFHDIGKIAIPDAILNKAGPLTEVEFEQIKTHPIVGEQILAPVPFLADVRRIVRHDHERWDGTGYPDGLRGPQIPLGSRIVLVVDAFHAMISDRPYRSAMPVADAYEELRAHAGSQFDPAVVEALLAVLQRGQTSDLRHQTSETSRDHLGPPNRSEA